MPLTFLHTQLSDIHRICLTEQFLCFANGAMQQYDGMRVVVSTVGIPGRVHCDDPRRYG